MRNLVGPGMTTDSQTDRSSRCAIAIMAKAPNQGRMKTRLSSFLAPEEANELGCCFLRDMTANLAAAAQSNALDPYVAFAPAGSETAFAGVVEPGTALVLADGSLRAPAGVAGFGTCLFQAAASLLQQGYGAVALLNSDSPNLPTSMLVEAAHALHAPGERAVLGPCLDGGYYLIGMKRAHAELFREIDWSTGVVAEQTRARSAEIGLDLRELAPWYDVDDARSLHALVQDLQDSSVAGAVAFAAPATRRFIEERHIAYRLAIELFAASVRPSRLPGLIR